MGPNSHHNTITQEIDDSKWKPLLAGHNMTLYLFYSAQLVVYTGPEREGVWCQPIIGLRSGDDHWAGYVNDWVLAVCWACVMTAWEWTRGGMFTSDPALGLGCGAGSDQDWLPLTFTQSRADWRLDKTSSWHWPTLIRVNTQPSAVNTRNINYRQL